MKPNLCTLLAIALLPIAAWGKIERVEPPFWWTDMPVSTLQIQIYAPNIGPFRAEIDYPGVRLTKQLSVDSRNYLFLYLEIGPETKPGTLQINLTYQDSQVKIPYELKQREDNSDRHQGFDSSDLVYLMMPDRFANGNIENDEIEGLMEGVDRSDPTKRQGGDLKGISDHLDYIDDLGMTAIWFTPTFENNSPPDYGGYHGYAATDLYQVDRRLGTNEEYKQLVDDVHQRGMKVIMDMIHNHIGLDHWWMSDLPTNDWVHDVEKYGYTNFRGPIPSDPYASQADKDRLIKGWFVPYMPDLNQRNELLADYLIQNTIWWIEYSGIDGIRMDTYLYPYPDYMARWAKEITDAYPNFNIVGEAWVETVAQEAYWQKDLPGIDDGYQSHLPSVTDFPYCFAVRNGLMEEFGWETGITRLYYLFSQDALYSDPNHNIIFLDNHDMGRIYEQLGRDEDLFKIAYQILLTSRGIPVVYYGTELMMGHEDRGGDDEAWRQTMPGGWPDDERSVFTEKGRTAKEKEILAFTHSLNHWRATCEAAQSGSFLHFAPEDGIYVYFRVLENEAIMTVVNSNDESKALTLSRFEEVLKTFSQAKRVPTSEELELKSELQIDARSALIIELNR
ncbi:glycoside hydrolase family 13 protein [Pelagicoccus sp. SDUM812003]|uniref:glycoside hydrolase family 13 protein n=1 Tax=Pelagicoccus sp. SDUM812003 TaxID=3041267 RepID=UPI00280D177B|nr:glycoside hydrolase family 13 protein [Pelagicoccus sp. SDUM812003]MDQ8202909.1 glycoside hydrolase family 13 protein [Pelagicoccus sp. SDUM812003]